MRLPRRLRRLALPLPGVAPVAPNGCSDVSVTVLQPPTIALSRSEVDFHAVSGADDPPGEEVVVMNEGDGDLLPLSVSVETGGPEWLSASIADFAAPTTLTVSASGVDGSREVTATAEPGPVSATRSSVTAEPEEGILACGVGVSTVTVILRDLHGNALTGMAGQRQVDLTGQATRPNVVETGPAGTYALEVRNDVAQPVTVTVTAAGVALEDQPMLEFVACCE